MMAIYRAVLVWVLRISAALVLVATALGVVRSAGIYSEARGSLDPAELASMPTLAEIVLQLLPAAGLAAIGLTLAEILAMQLRSAKNS